MPGNDHENIIDFVVHDTRGVLRFLGIELADDVVIVAERGFDATETTPKQLLADARIVIGKPPILGLVIEVQTTMTDKVWREKQFKWPHHAIGLRTKLRCVTETLVITTDPRIEKLARQPIQIGLNSLWHAIVLGPSNLPREPSLEFTRNNPTVALISLITHSQDYKTPETPANILKGLSESALYQALENSDQGLYYDRAMLALPLWIALALQEDPMTQEYFSPIVLDYIEQGREQGREQGIEQGREQGILTGLRQSIVLFLDSRGYNLTQADLQRIENEHKRSVLETWVKAAANQVPGQPFFEDH